MHLVILGTGPVPLRAFPNSEVCTTAKVREASKDDLHLHTGSAGPGSTEKCGELGVHERRQSKNRDE